MTEGAAFIRRIHDRLYGAGFAATDPDAPYEPHLTVGAFDDPGQMEAAWQTLKDTDDIFATLVTKISVEAIGPRGESIIVMEKELA